MLQSRTRCAQTPQCTLGRAHKAPVCTPPARSVLCPRRGPLKPPSPANPGARWTVPCLSCTCLCDSQDRLGVWGPWGRRQRVRMYLPLQHGVQKVLIVFCVTARLGGALAWLLLGVRRPTSALGAVLVPLRLCSPPRRLLADGLEAAARLPVGEGLLQRPPRTATTTHHKGLRVHPLGIPSPGLLHLALHALDRRGGPGR
mmetsp:Transcript_2061/g.5976  ORF Transcript_2061/g.5976 Transcript_2061/m.5976 type:complete len:200 (+) Transcript_2061:572-1171(+)